VLGPEEVRVNGRTVGECLDDLVRQHPDVKGLLFDSNGRLLKRVYVFVNAEGMYKADLDQAVREEDVLIVAVLAAGG
jgi:hypothetical protein